MKEVFKRNPKLEKLFTTADGTAFYNEGDARVHARTLSDKTVNIITRTEAMTNKDKPYKKAPEAPKKKAEKSAQKEDDTKVADLTPMQKAKLRIDAINELNTVEEIEQALSEETAKTVLKAGADRIAAIQATDALDGDENHPNVTQIN